MKVIKTSPDGTVTDLGIDVPHLRTVTHDYKGDPLPEVWQERLVRIINFDCEGYTCRTHREKKIYHLQLTWGRIGLYTGKLETFQVYRHQDGTACESEERISGVEPWREPECPKCHHKGEDTFKVRMMPYGNNTECQFCDYENYFSIGD